ncbi:hypothetical protein, partial [Salinibacter phage 5_6]
AALTASVSVQPGPPFLICSAYGSTDGP